MKTREAIKEAFTDPLAGGYLYSFVIVIAGVFVNSSLFMTLGIILFLSVMAAVIVEVLIDAR